MLAYGFFLSAKDAINIRSRKLNIPAEEYIKKTIYVGDPDLFKKDPMEYFNNNVQSRRFERFNNGLQSTVGLKYGNAIVFVGCLLEMSPAIFYLDEISNLIDKKKVESLAEELGFIGFEFRNYTMSTNVICFAALREKDIQEQSLKKLL